MNNKFVIFIIVSVLILIGFNYYSVKKRPAVKYPEKQEELKETEKLLLELDCLDTQ